MDEQLAEAVTRQTIGWAVLYDGEQEPFYAEDGWTIEQVRNFADSVDGIIAYIVSIKHISNEEIFGD